MLIESKLKYKEMAEWKQSLQKKKKKVQRITFMVFVFS